MTTIPIRMNGDLQTVALPKEFHLPCDAVQVSREGSRLILEPLEAAQEPAVAAAMWDEWEKCLNDFSPEFMADRQQPAAQERPELFD